MAKKVIHSIAKILSWVLFVLLLLIAAFLIYYYVATKIYEAKGSGYEPKLSIYTIISPSMTGTLDVYDAIVNIRVDDANDIEVGDIITFISTSTLSSGKTVTHRVVAITTDEATGEVCYVTKGDANNVEDQACARFSNVLGKVILKIPQLGQLQKFLATKSGWIICILIPALLIISRDIIKIANLNGIKNEVSKTNKKKSDPKKQEKERQRKEMLKRKLLNENTNTTKEYYREPTVKSITVNKKKKKK